MTDIRYIQSTERQVGEAHPTLDDTLNRALRDVLTASGADPDADFPGFGAPVYNVAAYGAVGDGVTDDAAAIRAAIAAAPAGSILQFTSNKTYAIASQVSWGKRLILSGYGATITEKTAITGTNADGAMFLATTGADGTVVEGLTFAGIETEAGFSGGATKQYCGLRFDTIARGTMRDVRATNKTYGFFAYSCTDLTVDNFQSTGFVTSNADTGVNYNAGIQIASCQRFTVTGHAQSHGDVVLATSPSTTCADGTITVDGKLLYDAGCYLSSGTRITVADCHFDQIDTAGGSGIIARGTNHAIIGCTVANVTGGRGIDVTGTGADDGTGYTGSGSRVEGCVAYNIDFEGIILDVVSGLYPRDCIVVGNTLDTCAVAGSGYYALVAGGSGHLIVNNTIWNTAAAASGVVLINGTAIYPCPGFTLSGNTIRAAATGPTTAWLIIYATNAIISGNTLGGAGTTEHFDLRNLTDATVSGNQGGTLKWNASYPSSSCQSFANEVTYAGDLTNLWGQGVEFQSGLNAKHITATRAAKTTAYTVTDADFYVPGSASGGAFSITLPTAVGRSGRIYVLSKVDNSTNAVTIGTTSSQTIDGLTLWLLRSQWQSIVVMSTGSNWEIIAQGGPAQTVVAAGTYSPGVSDEVILHSVSAGSASINLPAAANCRGKRMVVVKTDSTANTSTLDGNASETISGSLTYVLTAQYEFVAIQCDGANWFVVSAGMPKAAWGAKTADYTVVDKDEGLFLGDTTHTLTLQSAATRTRPLVLRSTASGNWTIARAGSDTIEGGTSVTLVPGEYATLMPNGTDWLLVG